MTSPRRLAVGIVGAGRSRNGLGPYLARDCERAGLFLAGIAGRDPARTAALAASFAGSFGHPVAMHASASDLARSGIDALIVATPSALHLDGLQAALANGLPCLCEKPLVVAGQFAAGRELAAAFAARGLLLMENCQWPFALPAFDALFPGARAAPPRRIAMGLSPGEAGPAMVVDSLSHLLSIAQAVLPSDAEPRVASASIDDHAFGGGTNALRARLEWPRGGVELELQLRVCARQPRPAWLSIDGRRMDRRIGNGYAIAFSDGAREVAADDPLPLCVAAFAQALRGQAPAQAAATRAVRVRLDLYAAIAEAIDLPDAG